MSWKNIVNDSYIHLIPDSSLEVHEDNFRLFFEIMYERMEIWYKKEILKEPFPWTKDQIFQEYKFTNLYRELDKNSQWEIKNIIQNPNLSRKNLLWQICLFRLINNPEFFSYIEYRTEGKWEHGIPRYDQYDEDKLCDYIIDYRRMGNNPYTSAYLLNVKCCTGFNKTLHNMNGGKRDWCFGRYILPTLFKNIVKINNVILKSKKPEEVYKILITLPSVSDFMANEIYTSLSYIPRYTNRKIMKWTDDDWTNIGPGCSLGLRLIFPSVKNGKKQYEQLKKFSKIGEIIFKDLDFKFIEYNKDTNQYDIVENCNLRLHQYEMWLCEFSKYWKILNGIRKRREKYVRKT